MKMSNGYIVFDVVNALGTCTLFPTTLSITELKLHVIKLQEGTLIHFSNKPKLVLHSFSAISYKMFSLAVGRGCGQLIQSDSEGRFCKFYQKYSRCLSG